MRASDSSSRENTCSVSMSGRVLMTVTGNPRTVRRTVLRSSAARATASRSLFRKLPNTSCPPPSLLELALLHLLEEVLALEIGVVVVRRRKRLIVFPALTRLGELLRFGGVLTNELCELLVVHEGSSFDRR